MKAKMKESQKPVSSTSHTDITLDELSEYVLSDQHQPEDLLESVVK